MEGSSPEDLSVGPSVINRTDRHSLLCSLSLELESPRLSELGFLSVEKESK